MTDLEKTLVGLAKKTLSNWNYALIAFESCVLSTHVGDIVLVVKIQCPDFETFEELNSGLIRHALVGAFKSVYKKSILVDIARPVSHKPVKLYPLQPRD